MKIKDIVFMNIVVTRVDTLYIVCTMLFQPSVDHVLCNGLLCDINVWQYISENYPDPVKSK
jgi:hypothetical protein